MKHVLSTSGSIQAFKNGMDYAIDKNSRIKNRKTRLDEKKGMSGGAIWMALGQEKSQTDSLEI